MSVLASRASSVSPVSRTLLDRAQLDHLDSVRVLFIDDSELDVELLCRGLRKRFGTVAHDRVDCPRSLRHMLYTRRYDLVLADWTIPGFGALEALAITQELAADLPFLVVSGLVEEERAAAAIRAGAHDFVSKDDLSGLTVAVERELMMVCRSRSVLDRQDQNERLLALASDLMCVCGFDGSIQRINAEWTRALGWSEADLVGAAWLDYVHPDDRDATHAVRERLVAVGQPVVGFTNRCRTKGGAYRALRWTAVAVTEERRIYAIAQDITDHQIAEDQLRQSRTLGAIGLVAGGIAHDLNNLLAIVATASEAMLDRLTASDPLLLEAQAIRDAGRRAAELTRQLLACSRRERVEPSVLDVSDLLRSMEGILRRLLRDDIELVLSPAPGLGTVCADPSQLEQVIMNLAINARDAMPTRGTLAIETADVELTEEDARERRGVRPGPYVMIAVTDSGIGIDATTRARMFEPFFTTKEPGIGTGLGLSTVIGIIEQSGGHLAVYTALGVGTRFEILLPRA